MIDVETQMDELTKIVGHLVKAQEKGRRRGVLLLGAGLALGFLMGTGVGTSVTAEGLPQRIVDGLSRDKQSLEADVKNAKEDFATKIQDVRQQLSHAKAGDDDLTKMMKMIMIT